MRGYPLLSLIVLLALLPGRAMSDANRDSFQHYQKLLDRYLIEHTLPGNGLVSAFDYRSALASDSLEKTLTEQRETLKAFNPGALGGKAESVAFWINASTFSCLIRFLPNGQTASLYLPYGTMAAELTRLSTAYLSGRTLLLAGVISASTIWRRKFCWARNTPARAGKMPGFILP